MVCAAITTDTPVPRGQFITPEVITYVHHASIDLFQGFKVPVRNDNTYLGKHCIHALTGRIHGSQRSRDAIDFSAPVALVKVLAT